VLALLAGCAGSTRTADVSAAGTRSFMMGFSGFPPKPDLGVAVQSIALWSQRADAAIMHLSVPWALLLADTAAEVALRRDGVDLARYYRGKQFHLVITIDVTDGLARDREAPELVAARRSITEPAVQRLYRDYVHAVISLLQPDYLGLAAETNLIRAAAQRPVYDAVVRMTNDAAADVRASGSASSPRLYVSVQVETAWGRLAGQGSYVGIDTDLHDFPFIAALGLSSYPYLGGFDTPESIPLDYYTRLVGPRALPVLVVEGGWASASVPGAFISSPAMQARYLAHQVKLLDRAHAVAVFQLSFADLDLASFPKPLPPILPLFASLGVVDASLRPKIALATWDSNFARRLQP
jgi:hypothetical protein